jgi:ribonuclease J
MVNLTFYGGVGEIGGNKILLEDGQKSLLLDFGLSYKRRRDFYEEYLKPRGGSGLLDLLTMGLIPPLQGIYRNDLEPEELWEHFHKHPLYRRVEHIDGLLLSHAHFDHSGNISLLKTEIPVYASAATTFLTKAIQDSGKSDFEQQICYYSPLILGCPKGCRQVALLSGSETRQQRQFHIQDVKLQALPPEAAAFWQSGFWEKTGRQKEINCLPLKNHSDCALKIRCFPVDHSIPGAAAWGIETTSGWVIYSGDLRLHGKRGNLTRQFIQEAAQLHPRALIIEGTNLLKESNVSESEVFRNALKAVASVKSLVVADFPARDIDRLLTFLQIARETDRKLAILPKDAYLLKTLRLLDNEIPDIASENNLVIYQDTTASKSPNMWIQNIYRDYNSKIVLADDVRVSQDEYILSFSFFDINELPSIKPAPGSLYLFSSSEPHDEEQEIDFRRLHNWLDHFSINHFGLPVEVKDHWEIPEAERGLHASGHACGTDLIEIINQIQPEIVIPVHTEHAGLYVQKLANQQIQVVLSTYGGAITV